MSSYVKVIDLSSKSKKRQESQLHEPDPPIPSVTLADLAPRIRQACEHMGWSSLLPVQQRAIPYLLAGRDIIVQSRTGSGKTGAFLLPMLEALDQTLSAVQCLVLTPTRELARQIFDTFQQLKESSPETQGLRGIAVYGGVGYREQIDAFNAGAHLVAGTPGRILDHLQKGTLTFKDLNVLILDEADEMLSIGFYPAMQDLKRYLPVPRQSYMFSATMPYNVRVLADEFLKDPGFLSLGRVSVETMRHAYFVVPPMEKNQALVRLIELHNPESAIIFANTRRRVELLSTYLSNYGFEVEGLSGDLSQKDRERVMSGVRSGNIRLLVATDVAARGIDISDVSHIYMYDVPQDPEYYVHRAGRTARAGKAGSVTALATMADLYQLQAIGKNYQIELERRDPPSDEEVLDHVNERLIELLENELRHLGSRETDVIGPYLPLVDELVGARDVKLLAMMLDHFYHESLHSSDEFDTSASHAESAVSSYQELARFLTENLEAFGQMQMQRTERFLRLAERLIDGGEPEIIALVMQHLMLDRQSGVIKATPRSEERTGQTSRRKKSKRSGSRRNHGGA